MFPWVCAHWVLTLRFREWQRDTEVSPALSLLQPTSWHHQGLSLFNPHMDLESILAMEWVILYFSCLWHQLHCPCTITRLPHYVMALPSPSARSSNFSFHQPVKPYLMSAHLFHEAFSIRAPSLYPRQKAAYCGGVKNDLWCLVDLVSNLGSAIY